jgi:hypothetical protein
MAEKTVDDAVPGEEILRQLMDGIGRQRDLYKELKQEIEALREQVEKSPTEADYDFIIAREKRKMELMGELGLCEKHLVPLRGKWEGVREKFDWSQREPLSLLVEELGALMQDAMSMEERNEVHMKKHCDAIALRLKSNQQARKANQAYGASGQSSNPKFYDKKK